MWTLDESANPGPNSSLYLLVRMLLPKIVVETGVASGRSPSSRLLALERDGK